MAQAAAAPAGAMAAPLVAATPHRSRSASKRGSDDERNRSESGKRQRTDTRHASDVERNSIYLVELGMSKEKQNEKFGSLNGAALIAAQKKAIKFAIEAHSGGRITYN